MTLAQTSWTPRITRRAIKKMIILASLLGIGILIVNLDRVFKKHNCGIKSRYDEFEEEGFRMDVMEARMERRRKRLEENCKFFCLHVKGNDSLHMPNTWEFLINRPFHLVWCNVFKAASTSWMYNFNILAGYKPEFLQRTKEVPLQLARNKYPRPSLKNLTDALNDSTSFLIVRHPLDRLLSGYRDKIEHALPNTYHYKLGNLIIKNYRSNKNNVPHETGKLSIFTYLRRIRTRPTFSEFVDYVIDLYDAGKPLDMHWTPINTFCTPCQIRFDIIMKFSTLHEDQSYLIEKKHLQSWIKSQWKNPTRGKKDISKYFKQLNATQIYHLYKIYMYDFHLFDYNLEEYLKYINADKNDTTLKMLKYVFDSNSKHKQAILSI